jgi:hypothetical protein
MTLQRPYRPAALLVAAGLAIAAAVAPAAAQPLPIETGEHTFMIVVEDSVRYQRVLRCGTAPGAEYAFEPARGEMAIPPVPGAPVFDARFLDLPGRQRFPGTGGVTDIRGEQEGAVPDTFLIRFQPYERLYPVRLRWCGDAGSLFETAVMEYTERGGRRSVPLRSARVLEIRDPEVTMVTLILAGPGR